MNYLRNYCNLIRKAENRTPPEGYTERHHVFPISIYGDNDRFVILTAREHYIAHALLEKICLKRYGLNHWKTKKMIHAHIMMKPCSYFNSYLYEHCKKRKSLIMKQNKFRIGKKHSEESKNKIRSKRLEKNIDTSGEKNGMFGKKHSEETKKKMSASNNNKGRRWWNNGITNVMSKNCPGDEWKIGKTPGKSYKLPGRIGYKWWNNGVENKCCKDCPGENWKHGRIKKIDK